uniref:glucuronosyltransferase n=1 Tax=Caenorhabditis tropicalis TaxID=1561998 RepID=A0A1I7UJ15_9PELO
MARLADTLTEAGHNVTFFTPIIDESRRNQLGVKVTKDVIQLEQDPIMKEKKVSIDDMMHIFWTMDVTSKNGHRILETMHQQAVLTCDNLFRSKELIEELRSKEYDVALAEPLMTCGLALFRHIEIEKVIITSSCVNYDILIPAIGEPEDTSYLPSMNSQVTEKMSFEERLENFEMFNLMLDTFGKMFDDEAKIYRNHLGAEFPSWRDLIPDASLHFINSIPSIDFPRPSFQKTIEIGGISVEIEKIEKLDSHFSEILDRRQLNMLISFGSLTKSSTMPPEFKKNLLEVFREEPNCTFI